MQTSGVEGNTPATILVRSAPATAIATAPVTTSTYEIIFVKLAKRIADHPDDALAYNERGFIHLHLRQFDFALRDLDKAIELDPKFVHAYMSRGVTYRFQRKFSLALTDLNKAIELEPNYATAYQQRGIAYSHQCARDLLSGFHFAFDRHSREVCGAQCKKDLALQNLNKAIELAPNDAPGYCSRGYFFAFHAQSSLAIHDFEKAIELSPDKPSNYFYKGCVSILQDRYHLQPQLAVAAFTEAIRFHPDCFLSSYLCAFCYQCYRLRAWGCCDFGKWDLALSDYNKLIGIDSEDAKLYIYRGVIFSRQGQVELALADFQQGKKLCPAYSTEINRLICAFDLPGMPDINRRIREAYIAISAKRSRLHGEKSKDFKAPSQAPNHANKSVPIESNQDVIREPEAAEANEEANDRKRQKTMGANHDIANSS